MTLKTENKTEFNLATADKFELKKFAQDEYGLPLTMNMNEDTMRGHIQEFCEDNNIDLPTSHIGVDTPKDKKGKKFTINVATAEGKHGDVPVFVGVQGVGYTIPRGIDVVVPAKIVEALKNAMQDIVTQDEHTGEMLHREVRTYPFSIISEAA